MAAVTRRHDARPFGLSSCSSNPSIHISDWLSSIQLNSIDLRSTCDSICDYFYVRTNINRCTSMSIHEPAKGSVVAFSHQTNKSIFITACWTFNGFMMHSKWYSSIVTNEIQSDEKSKQTQQMKCSYSTLEYRLL